MAHQKLKTKKYLLFSMSERKTGVDNIFRMLNLIFKEAVHLGRVPAIGKFTISSTHNLGKSTAELCFEDYLDLSDGVIVRFEDGCHRPMRTRLEWIKEDDLDLASYATDKVRILAPGEIVSDEMNRQYDVIIRRDPSFKYIRACAAYKYGGFLIDFPYSEKVNKLTDEVLAILGISREHAIAAQHYFLGRVGDMPPCEEDVIGVRYENIPLARSYYACMHVRAAIKDRDYEQPIFTFASSRKQIKSVLEHVLDKGSRIYIMSDIHQSDFFDFLKLDYQIYRYHDFPQLKDLVANDVGCKIDNVMLYLVEKNIMKHATVKILPPHKGPMIYHLNTVCDLTFIKKPPTRKKPLARAIIEKLVFATKCECVAKGAIKLLNKVKTALK